MEPCVKCITPYYYVRQDALPYDPLSYRPHSDFRPRRRAHLMQYPLHMLVHRLRPDPQRCCDLLVCSSA